MIFDIETGALPLEIVRERVPEFQPPPPPGEFDPAAVKTGNLKDPEKIREKVAAAAVAHEHAVARYGRDVQEAENRYYADALSKAALSPITGLVLAIGYLTESTTVLDIDEEPPLLHRFWQQYLYCRSKNEKLVGHNIFNFDLPFLIRRSWLLDIEIPPGLLEHRRWIDSTTFEDTMSLWACGGHREYQSLDGLAKAFGVGGKLEGVNGQQFAELLATDRPLAEKYLATDLTITRAIAERMGVI